MFDHFISSPMRRAATPALLAASLLAAFAAVAQTGPSQTPLITRASAQVRPNMMVTVDDSGSMTWSYMPEGVMTYAQTKYQIPMPPSLVMSDILNEPVVTYSAAFNTVYSATAIPNDKVHQFMPQVWLRSPQINSIYYDPSVLYLPWMKPAADGTRYPAAKYTAAVYDPTGLLAGQIDLSQNVTLTPSSLKDPKSGKTYPTRWVTKLTNNAGVSSATYDDNAYLSDPALYYILKDGSDPTVWSSYVEYDLNNGVSSTTYTKYPARTDCKGSVCTQTEERQNYANWFVYYRTRHLMAKAALSEALPSAVKLVRLGWGSINYGGVIRTKITDLTDASVLSPILTGIQGFKPGNSTPLRTALTSVGAYFQKDLTDADNPWLDNLGDVSSPAAACRRSYNILTTDGYYNDNFTSVGNVDKADGGADGVANRANSVPADNPLNASITKYQAASPFADDQSNMLADVAEYYYVNDLQPKIANKVQPSLVDTKNKYPTEGMTWQNDIAYWQHLQQFTVGLGVKGQLQADPTQPGYSMASLLSPSQWYMNGSTKVVGTGPTAWSNDHIDDLWHAALNSHGKYFSVRNSVDLTRALGDVIGQASGTQSGQAGAVASTTTIQTTTLAYIPKYVPVAWTGDLMAYHLDQVTGKPTDVVWHATDAGLVPPYGSRNSWVMASDGSGGQPFKWGSLDSGNQALVNIGTQALFGTTGSDALINYIKGDASNEGSSGLYRARSRQNPDTKSTTTLPDYVDSPPLLVQNFMNAGYGTTVSCGGVTYNDYFSTVKDARTTGTLFVGGNGGMLNAFDSKTGKELFDYVPRAGLQNLATVAYKGYSSSSYPHQFFVDGPLTESDACLTRNGKQAWTNLVVGALGAGGSGVFVLDTTSVGSAAAHFDGTMPLREWSGVNDNDIGDIFSNPKVAMVKGGSWKVITGNGVYSKSGRAALMVLDLATGTAERVYLGTGTSSGAMGVQLVYDGTMQAIGAYVGDIQGNMWRVEFGGPNQADWRVGNGGVPLFTATGPGGKAQPITATPALALNATGQTVVLFGTGKLYDSVDPDNKDVQTSYGIVDPTPMTQTASKGTLTRAALDVQKITDVNSATAKDGTVGYYYTVAPQGTPNGKGWLMDLVYTDKAPTIDAGTRVIYPEIAIGTDTVFVNAVTPAGVPAECDTALGKGYFFLLDAATGGQSSDPTWDTNGDGNFDSSDITGGGVATSAGGTATQVYKGTDAGDGIFFINSDQGHLGRPPSHKCTTNCVVTDRVWRQILTPPTP